MRVLRKSTGYHANATLARISPPLLLAFPPLREGRSSHTGGEATLAQVAQDAGPGPCSRRRFDEMPARLGKRLLAPVGAELFQCLLNERVVNTMLRQLCTNAQITVALGSAMTRQRSCKACVAQIPVSPQPRQRGLDRCLGEPALVQFAPELQSTVLTAHQQTQGSSDGLRRVILRRWPALHWLAGARACNAPATSVRYRPRGRDAPSGTAVHSPGPDQYVRRYSCTRPRPCRSALP